MRTILSATTTLVLAVAFLVPVAAQTDDGIRPSGGCEAPLLAPGDYEAINEFDGADQKYFVIVPESYGKVAPAPLYLWLAAGGGEADMTYAGWRGAFDDEPMLIAIIGTETVTQHAPATLLALVDELAADYCVDLRRIHVYGSSSSAFTATQLACEGSDRIASVFDGMGYFTVSTCEPDRPVPLLAITGDPDRSSVSTSVASWAERNGCDPKPLVEDLGSGISRTSYQDCEADVLFYDIEGLGHKAVLHECGGPYAETYYGPASWQPPMRSPEIVASIRSPRPCRSSRSRSISRSRTPGPGCGSHCGTGTCGCR